MWKKYHIIPDDTLVVVDGRSSQEYNARYKYTCLGLKQNMKNFMPSGVRCIPRTKVRSKSRKKLFDDPRPKIILAPGGMGTYGPVTSYLTEFIPRDDVLVHALGYCSPGSIMYKLLHSEDGDIIKYNGQKLVKRCVVKKTAEKSSHAPRDVLLRLIKTFPNTKSISINHGNPDIQLAFREYLLDHLGLPESQIMVADPLNKVRIKSDGIVDVLPNNLFNIF